MEAVKKGFLEKLKALAALDFPEDQYVIWGSGPLAIRGLREARDIDLVVTKDFWDKLVQKYPPEGPKKNKIKIGEIEIWRDLLNLTDQIDAIIADCEIIEGFPFMKLAYTLEWKRYWNSKKDPKDIALIEKYCQCEKIKER